MLSLIHNPVVTRRNYREYVIHKFPNLKVSPSLSYTGVCKVGNFIKPLGKEIKWGRREWEKKKERKVEGHK